MPFPFQPYPRKCNQYSCDGLMRPTREFCEYNDTLRIHQCVKCGKKNPWLDKPLLNGSFAQLHCIKWNLFSGMSMMSDPNIYPPKPPKFVRPTRPRRGLK